MNLWDALVQWLFSWWSLPLVIVTLLAVLFRAGYELWKEEEQARKKAEAQLQSAEQERENLKQDKETLSKELEALKARLEPKAPDTTTGARAIGDSVLRFYDSSFQGFQKGVDVRDRANVEFSRSEYVSFLHSHPLGKAEAARKRPRSLPL